MSAFSNLNAPDSSDGRIIVFEISKRLIYSRQTSSQVRNTYCIIREFRVYYVTGHIFLVHNAKKII